MTMSTVRMRGTQNANKFFVRRRKEKSPLGKPRHRCLLLIPQSFDWLAAFHLDLLQAILFIAG